MTKPDPALLDPARYPFSCEIGTRFTDIDTNQHVNNAALADILQEGRVRFHHATKYDRSVMSASAMAVSFSVDYLGQGYHPDPMDVHVAGLAVGRTSHTVGQLVTQHGNVVAYARTVVVSVKDDRPFPNSEEFVAAFAPWMLKP